MAEIPTNRVCRPRLVKYEVGDTAMPEYDDWTLADESALRL